KHFRFKIILPCVLLAAGVGTILFLNNEPRADGHPLSYWLQLGSEQDSNDIFSASKHPNEEADAAVRKVGERAVPILVQKLRARNPKWRDPAFRWLARVGFHLNLGNPSKAERECAEAEYGFRILGTQAVAAIPQIAPMLLDTNDTFRTAYALAMIGPTAAPHIRAALTNSNLEICKYAVLATGWSRDIGRQVVTELIMLTTNADRKVASYAMMQLRPLLPMDEYFRVANAVSGPNQNVMLRISLRALAESTINVTSAVPVIVPLLASPDEGMRILATNALVQIDPALATAHGIDTNAPRPIDDVARRPRPRPPTK